MKKKILSALLVLAMVLCLIPATVATVSAEDAVTVEDWSATEIHLKNNADWLAFLSKLNVLNAFAGQTVYLDNDLDLENTTVPVGNDSSKKIYKQGFAGTFDGQNHSISNFNMTKSETASSDFGMFGSLLDAASNALVITIKNVSFYNCSVSGSARIGALYGYLECKDGIFENLYLDIDVTSGDTTGVVAEFGDSHPTNLHFNNVIYVGTAKAAKNVGGFLGYGWGKANTASYPGLININFSNCVFAGTLENTNTNESTGSVAAGFIAYADFGSYNKGPINFENCVSVGTLKASVTPMLAGFVYFCHCNASETTKVTVNYTHCVNDCGLDSTNAWLGKTDGENLSVTECVVNPGVTGIAYQTVLDTNNMTGFMVSTTGAPMPTTLVKKGLVPVADCSDTNAVTDVIGYQSTVADAGKFSVRLVGAIEEGTTLSNYKEVGILLSAIYTDGTEKTISGERSTEKVWTGLSANEGAVTYTAEDLDSEALYVIVCNNVPEGALLEVTSFATLTDGTKVLGKTHVISPVADAHTPSAS